MGTPATTVTTVTTTPYVPPPTLAPTPAPTPGSPCAPVVPAPVPVPVPTPSSPCETAPPTERKYDAKKATFVQQAATPKAESSMVPALAFPLFGVVAMFSLAAVVGLRARSQRSTRQVSILEPDFDQEALLNGDAIE